MSESSKKKNKSKPKEAHESVPIEEEQQQQREGAHNNNNNSNNPSVSNASHNSHSQPQQQSNTHHHQQPTVHPLNNNPSPHHPLTPPPQHRRTPLQSRSYLNFSHGSYLNNPNTTSPINNQPHPNPYRTVSFSNDQNQNHPNNNNHHLTTPHLINPSSSTNQQIGSAMGMGNDQKSITSEDNNDLIYGTLISVKNVYRDLERFIMEFEAEVPEEEDNDKNDESNDDGNKIVTEQQSQRKKQHKEKTFEKKYLTKLYELDLLQTNILNVDAKDLKEFDQQLYYQLIYFPAEMIVLFDDTLKLLYEKYFILNYNSDGVNSERSLPSSSDHPLDQETLQRRKNRRDSLKIGIHNLCSIKQMRSITINQINRLISFHGIVIKCSDIIPQMKTAFFKCTLCQSTLYVELQNAKVSQPSHCPNPKCNKSNNPFELIHNQCLFTDKQYIKLQQPIQNIPQGQTPFSITVIVYDENVDYMKPGDHMEVVGIYRSSTNKVSKGKSQVKTLFSTHIDMISCRELDQNHSKYKRTDGLGSGQNEGYGSGGSYKGNNVRFNDKDKEIFFKMVENDGIIQRLVNSFAPSLYGNHEVKKGILAQLFGGANKNPQQQHQSYNHDHHQNSSQSSQQPYTKFRSDINICLIGDPSTAKSQLLQQVYKIAPRSIYTVGRGTTSVGLTANVRRDPQTKQFVLQSGALVLSDQGICCIDEFDKMDNDNKTILLEGMQQQTISIAKAGIVCQLNCRTGIIAAANPINSRYNPKKSVIENINLPPALLSRFDLIYIMLDKPEEKYDRKIAEHLLNLYTAGGHNSHPNIPLSTTNPTQTSTSTSTSSSTTHAPYSKQTLTKYITYARQYINPILTESACQHLIKSYTQMRRLGSTNIKSKTITSTPRQLESMIRLSEAFAKMELSQNVTEKHVEEAYELITYAMKQSATDPLTGLIDMDVITTGKTSATRERVRNVVEVLKGYFEANAGMLKYGSTGRIKDKEKDAGDDEHGGVLEKGSTMGGGIHMGGGKAKKKIPFESIVSVVSNEMNNQRKERDGGSLAASMGEKVTEREVHEALRLLESEGYVSCFGSDKYRPYVRLIKQF